MKNFLLLLSFILCFNSWGQDSLFFESERAMANYAFQNTNFGVYNIRFFKDRMFEYNDSVFAFYTTVQSNKVVHAYHAFELSKHIENWDLQETFSADSILHPVVSKLYNLTGNNEYHLPIVIVDLDVSELKSNVKSDFEENIIEDPIRGLIVSDFNHKRADLACLPLDTLNYAHLWLDLDQRFITQNTGREVEHVTVSDGTNSVTLYIGQSADISNVFRDGTVLTFEVKFNDGTYTSYEQSVYFVNQIPAAKGNTKSLNLGFTNSPIGLWPYEGESNPSESRPSGQYGISYACSDNVLRKPYIMIAGWGPYTDNTLINSTQNWPTPMWKMANQMNQDSLIEKLNEQGFDVAILQLIPPNAYVEGNAVVIEQLINLLNIEAAENGYHEEIIVHGFSAGALGARLALQKMEKKHLEQNGRHPHVRLYVSTDGEHMGANVPLGVQKAVKYLWDYESQGYNYPKLYALRYILHAPQSREILFYWHERMNEYGDKGEDPRRADLLAFQTAQNHYLTDVANKSGFPNFMRMISLSNGQHTPNYTGYTANHSPLPSETGMLVFEDAEGRHRSKIRYLTHGESEVFLYRKRSWGNWTVKERGIVNNALVLDNAAGGMMFIEENPINRTLELMDKETYGEASTLYYTNFCFTPTVFTHNIRNYTIDVQNGYINYNLREQGLMFQTHENALLSWETYSSEYFGYPHLAHPLTHYSITPFDAIFTGPQINEHLRFNYEICDANRSIESFEAIPLEPVKNNYKNFILGEAEGVDLCIQNRNIGYYKRPGYTYYVDFTAKNRIDMGQNVTNKTDFKPASVEENTVVMAMAKNEISLKPGVHFKSGSSVHLVIGEIECEKSFSNSDASEDNDNSSYSVGSRNGIVTTEDRDTDIIIFPNPSVSSFKIRYLDKEINQAVHVIICDLNGTMLLEMNVVSGKEVKHNLSQGTYIVRIKYNDLWISKRLVVD